MLNPKKFIWVKILNPIKAKLRWVKILNPREVRMSENTQSNQSWAQMSKKDLILKELEWVKNTLFIISKSK